MCDHSCELEGRGVDTEYKEIRLIGIPFPLGLYTWSNKNVGEDGTKEDKEEEKCEEEGKNNGC